MPRYTEGGIETSPTNGVLEYIGRKRVSLDGGKQDKKRMASCIDVTTEADKLRKNGEKDTRMAND